MVCVFLLIAVCVVICVLCRVLLRGVCFVFFWSECLYLCYMLSCVCCSDCCSDCLCIVSVLLEIMFDWLRLHGLESLLFCMCFFCLAL